MADKILVAYASLTGSTTEVAEAIGKTLVDSGLQVDVRPMTEVTDLAPYRAVVAGSAIHGGKWLPEAMQFMYTYQAELSRRPFAAFLVCITLGMPELRQIPPGGLGLVGAGAQPGQAGQRRPVCRKHAAQQAALHLRCHHGARGCDPESPAQRRPPRLGGRARLGRRPAGAAFIRRQCHSEPSRPFGRTAECRLAISD